MNKLVLYQLPAVKATAGFFCGMSEAPAVLVETVPGWDKRHKTMHGECEWKGGGGGGGKGHGGRGEGFTWGSAFWSSGGLASSASSSKPMPESSALLFGPACQHHHHDIL